MATSSTKPRSKAWAAILALAMEMSLSPASCLAAAIPLSTLSAKVMVFQPVRERVSGPEHPDTLIARANLAHWSRQAGDAEPGVT